ncbi:Nucleolar 27S pre-rRNA processing, Urb2/Npa2 [Ascosphaera apis ARSEF 7405]|uniref:Nucleolar 27S pre-rRNA processing, Urb2/Npa2 n=1 Tax=Ascosphaera apis ARSEF 7405 TaxID=392613 RepID=A0A167W5Y9_9EURO|nr:Nucleolar 27S pre-rRNA processing, Urb2/Npa2 [Ascosphaera apis ARSEF 7405]
MSSSLVLQHESSHQALLKLEGGSDTPSVQLHEAAGIIGIDLDTPVDQAATTAWSAPKEEWVLRWLMKKTRSSNAEGQGYRLHPTSWKLYRNLVYRIPARSLTALLHEYKLLDILKATFRDLDTSANTTATTSDDPTPSGKRGKKRKRPSEINSAKDAEQTAEDGSTGMTVQSQGHILLSILQFIHSLSSIPSNSAPNHISEMKAKVQLVLRGDVQTAAQIIGSAYRHASAAISKWTANGSDESIDQLLQAMFSLQIVWDCRVDRSAVDKNSLSTTDGFAAYILPESLELLSRLRHLPSSTNLSRISTIVEGTIALSFVLPLRDTFFSKYGTNAVSNDTSPSPSTFLFTELRSRMKTRDNDLANHLLPILLDVIARTVPRDTFRKESQEAPWLEMVFISLTSRCGCPPFPDPVWNGISASVDVLNDLLDISIKRRIRLSLPVLCQYAKLYSGLDGDSGVNWLLIANLFRLSVDIFLPNSGLAVSKDLLTSLVTRISDLWLQKSDVDSTTYGILKDGIIIPLLRGFADARDLPTFVQLWSEQLETIQDARNKSDNPEALSVWEDDDVAAVYSAVMNVGLSSQTIQRVDELFTSLSDSASGFSSAILLDATFPIVSADIEIEQLKQYANLLYDALEAQRKNQWRLWRLSCHFVEKAYPAIRLGSDILDKFVTAAIRTVEGVVGKGLKIKSISDHQYWASLHAYRYLIFITSQDFGNSYTRLVEPIISRFADTMHELATSTKKSPAKSLGGMISFIQNSLAATLAAPAFISKISSESRIALFKSIFAIDPVSAPEVFGCFPHIWDILVTPDWVEAAPSVVHDLIIVVLDHLEADKSLNTRLIATLSSIPSALIPPHQRVKLLDSLQQHLLSQSSIDVQAGVTILSLMTRLVESPKSSSSKIVSDPSGLWDIAKKLSTSDIRIPLHSSFRQFFMAVIGRVTLLAETSRQIVLRKLADLALQASFKSSSQLNSIHFFVCILTVQTLTSAQYEGYIEDERVRDRLHDLRGELNTLLSDSLSTFRRAAKSSSNNADLEAFMSVLACLQTFDKSGLDDKVCKTLKKIDSSGNVANMDVSVGTMLKRSRIHLEQGDVKDMDEFLESCLSLFPADRLQSDEVRKTLHEIQQRIATLDQNRICELLTRSFQSSFERHDISNRFILAGLLFSSLKTVEERDGIVFKTVSSLFSELCRLIPLSETSEAFFLNMESLDLLLHSQTRCLTQWNIDNLLASLSIILSTSGMQKLRDVSSPGALYLRICRILTMLFGQYRQKLSGRMHIVVTLMQRLLRCLFIYEVRPGAPGISQAKLVKMTSALPSWITSQEECEIPRQAEYAIQYTRLLTLLCDPTVSAVQRHMSSRALSGHGSSGQLTDNTKKVKSLAGQHLQYVILEYAICSLRGRLLPAVKAALVPGLYAILNVMTQEVMRGMNASMDGSSRAMFRSLYEDYVRFGRWDQG